MTPRPATDDDFEVSSKRQVARALTGRRPVCPAADYDFVKNFLLQSFLLYNKIFSSVLFTFLFIQVRD